MRLSISALSGHRRRPPLLVGLLVMIACVAAETLFARLLAGVIAVHSLDVVFLGGVVLMSVLWGLTLGIVTAVISAVAFDLVLTPPMWSLRPGGEFLAMCALFLVLALLGYSISSLARSRASELDARKDADLSAQLARLVLQAPSIAMAMPSAARHLARALGLPSAAIRPGAAAGDERHTAFPLCDENARATLIVPAGLAEPTLERLRDRTVPSLESLLRAARQRDSAADALRASHDRLRRIADEQAALRHLATLVAHNVPPSEVFNAVAREMGQILGAEHTVINRYESDGAEVTTVGVWNYDDIAPPGLRWRVEMGTVSELVYRTKAPGRITGYQGTGMLVTTLRDRGVVSSVGSPIVVGRHLWGVAIASSTTTDPLPPDTEARMLDFVELAATAIANAQNHSDLIVSRARLVAATDETRRRIERDLHDGTQQHLVSVLLDIRTMERNLPPGPHPLKHRLSDTAQALESAVAELQEIARGLHPAALTRGGLRQALGALARRSAIAVTFEISAERPLPQAIEVTVYYIVAESLANAAKHAHATAVRIGITMSDTLIRVSVRDDGIGGADPARGSGLTGLTDRVVALGGRLDITSPASGGTTLSAEIPTTPPHGSS